MFLVAQDALEQEIMPVMDDYYLSKEDWDAFVELGVGHMQDEKILKLIPSATKAAFTRSWVSRRFRNVRFETDISSVSATTRETTLLHSTRETSLLGGRWLLRRDRSRIPRMFKT